ncbi:hypothetical protein L249_6222 [Ophiocordyceps polyrhachis-furcata BCC 54312]|uniref:Uncharacterized protein n=1 Tax=Ophiocordyceps polyrhachis-furcata BCC 54312 TaxID=1330021 RepID=A0A367L161_9HYPO|nr:hypothetical protein L249_6222 [Ophiocordyceps polyrhachis-furcata BCC 54312]
MAMITLPFFFPGGFTTPTGVIMFSFGIPNSSSVYVFFLGFFERAAAIFLSFSCFDGGAAFGFAFDLVTPSVDDLLERFLRAPL